MGQVVDPLNEGQEYKAEAAYWMWNWRQLNKYRVVILWGLATSGNNSRWPGNGIQCSGFPLWWERFSVVCRTRKARNGTFVPHHSRGAVAYFVFINSFPFHYTTRTYRQTTITVKAPSPEEPPSMSRPVRHSLICITGVLGLVAAVTWLRLNYYEYGYYYGHLPCTWH